MEIAWYIYVIAFAGAVVAGAINTLAGNGSAITLSILTELMGLPGNLANGTNRIGVLFNGIGSTWGFYRGGKLNLADSRTVIIIVVLGAIAGGVIALNISNEQFMWLFKGLMVVMLVVILVKPQRWLIKTRQAAQVPDLLLWPMYFAIGVYGGLIQMGMGVFFLAVLVLLARYPLIHANAIKVACVAIYTILMVGLFAYRGLIDWPIGLLMGGGQFIGGWYTARLASRHPAAGKWAYGLLVAIVLLSLLSLFGAV
ncbi:MAG: sulfite exporter TauE/SafE family protein [Saprospiraceae bacterium]|nr:sulfite exporter TauE/SafE family protein [Saprospiraceae bacterium]